MIIKKETEQKHLRMKVYHEYKKICDLEEKLKRYNEDVCEKEELQIRINDLQRILEEIEFGMKQTYEDHLKMKDSILKKLDHYKIIENSVHVKNQRLNDAIDQKTKHLDTLKLDKEKRTRDIENLNMCNENLKNEMNNSEVSININYVCRGNGIMLLFV